MLRSRPIAMGAVKDKSSVISSIVLSMNPGIRERTGSANIIANFPGSDKETSQSSRQAGWNPAARLMSSSAKAGKNKMSE
jgi:hypothetical protein